MLEVLHAVISQRRGEKLQVQGTSIEGRGKTKTIFTLVLLIDG
jgi:hypothetical protein